VNRDPHYPKVVRYEAALQVGNRSEAEVLPLHNAWLRGCFGSTRSLRALPWLRVADLSLEGGQDSLDMDNSGSLERVRPLPSNG